METTKERFEHMKEYATRQAKGILVSFGPILFPYLFQLRVRPNVVTPIDGLVGWWTGNEDAFDFG